ncbi:MAG: autotransporter domain-containing protein, partial [Planctomycetota bacterium]|nr:autotransporter domain-containing protein [Planctomycetota bacterium]
GKTYTITGGINAAGGTFATTDTGLVTINGSLNVTGGMLQIGSNGSTLAPITVTGTLDMDANTTISVAGYSGTGTQTIVTGGTITFASGALATYLASQNYTTMLGSYDFTGTVAGGINLNFTAATGSVRDQFNTIAAGLGFGDIAGGASDSYIGAVRDAVVAVNGTSNATNAVGATTEQILAAVGGQANNGYDFAANNAEGRAAYQGTTGKVFANSIHVATDTVSRHIDMANYNLGTLGIGAPPAYGQASIQSANGLASFAVNCGAYVNRIWLGGFGVWNDVDARRNDGGYKYDSGGAIVGFDRTVGGALTVGGSFAATFGSYKDKQVLSNDSDINTYSFNLYAQYKAANGFFGRIMGGYAYTDDDIDIQYTLANREQADYHVNTWSVGGALGYELKLNECFTLTPSVGLYYYDSRSNKFNSSTKTGVRLDYDRLETPVDLVASYAVINTGDSKLALNANVGYAYNFNDNAADGRFTYTGLPGSVYVEGRDVGRHTVKAGGGFKYERGNLDFAVNYDYRHKARSDSHSVFAAVGLKF